MIKTVNQQLNFLAVPKFEAETVAKSHADKAFTGPWFDLLKPTNNQIHNLHDNSDLASHTTVSRRAIIYSITFMAQVMCDD